MLWGFSLFLQKNTKDPVEKKKKMMSCETGLGSYAAPGDSTQFICLNLQLTAATSL